ncbi:MAG: hypothetical protein EOO04_21440 [Chitinophagaceae bacterium]|nr:MAG: hypothetical protein EOO04_21440 [Chitinophagaceae bacterium]
MGQILLGLFAAYLLYNFVFRFLIPLIRVTRQVKRQVRDFQQHVNTQQPGGYQPGGAGGGYGASSNQPGHSGHYQAGGFQPGDFPGSTRTQSSTRNGTTTGAEKHATRPAKDDYIDFEEIK